MRIFIIGPGGAGKTTSGRVLAEKIGYKFLDLDEEFIRKHETPGEFIEKYSYKEYYEKNSEIFFNLLSANKNRTVFALSSGFLVYPDVNLVKKHKKAIDENGISVLILPSGSLKEAREIIIDRQLERGFGLQEGQEVKKINQRFWFYKMLGDIKIFSNKKPAEIADLAINELNRNFL